MNVVAVNPEVCVGCEDCVTLCPQGVFRMLDEKADPYQSSECVFCEICLQSCPARAISVYEL